MNSLFSANVLLALLASLSWLACVDGAAPELAEFRFDAGSDEATFVFDQEVQSERFDYSKVAFQGLQVLNGTQGYNFTLPPPRNDPTLYGNTTTITYSMTSESAARFKWSGVPFGKREGTLFVAMEKDTVRNLDGEMNEAVTTEDAFAATSFTRDTGSGNEPGIDTFDLDMATGIMQLNFTEPVNASTFTLVGLGFQSRQTYDASDTKQVYLVDTGYSFLGISNFDRTIEVALGNTNLNTIKEQPGLCSSEKSTYLFTRDGFDYVRDFGGTPANTAPQFLSSNGGRVRLYSIDNVAPTLVNWEFDYNAATMTLQFSETVVAASIKYDRIYIVKDASNQTMVQLEEPEDPPSANSDRIVINVNFGQMNSLKNRNDILKTFDTSYVVIEVDAVEDTAPLENRYKGVDATIDDPRQVYVLQLDTISPSLSFWALDMTQEKVTLTFDEIIDISTFDVGKISISADADSAAKGVSLSTTLATVLTTENAVAVEISLSKEVLADMKLETTLTTMARNSFVSFPATLLKDVAPVPNAAVGIPITAAAVLGSSYFTPDNNRPIIESWALDMGTVQLTLDLSEPMNPETLNVADITLQTDSETLASTIAVSLTADSEVIEQTRSRMVIKLCSLDASTIKSQVPLCTSGDLCYLKHTEELGFDMSTFSSGGLEVKNAPLAKDPSTGAFTADTYPPYLESFSMNMKAGVVELTFTEPVDYSNLDASGLGFTEIQSLEDGVIPLFLSNHSFSNQSTLATIQVLLTNEDLNSIKAYGNLASSVSKVWAQVRSNFVKDMAGNAIAGLRYEGGSQSPLPVTDFVDDTAVPEIVGMMVLRDNGTSPTNVHVYFNDVVDPTSVVATSFELRKTADISSAGDNFLETPLITSADSEFLDFNISVLSFQASMAQQNFGKTVTTSYLHVKAAAVADNSLAENLVAKTAMGFKEGNTVLSFRFVINKRKLILEFGMPWKLKTLDASRLSLRDPLGFVSISLTGMYTYNFEDPIRVIELDITNDLPAIQEVFLGSLESRDDVQLMLSVGGFTDDEGRTLTYPSAHTVDCIQLTTDVTPPSVTDFQLNLGAGTMRVVFSEPVMLETLVVNKFAVQNTNDTTSDMVRIYLTKSAVLTTGESATTLDFDMSVGSFPADRDKIHLTQVVGLDFDTSYLFIEKGSVRDTATPPNFFPESYPFMATVLTQDTANPEMVYFGLDMNTGLLVVNFNEVIRISSVDPTKLRIVEDSDDETSVKYQLQTSTVDTTGVEDDAAQFVTIQLSTRDLDNIFLLAPHLCLDRTNTQLSIRAGFVRDIGSNNNQMLEILDRYAITAADFRADSVRPLLIAYDLFIGNRTIDMYFDEVVNCPATDLSKLYFQAMQNIGSTNTEKMQLTVESSKVVCEYNYQKMVRITVGLDDLKSIKRFPNLGKNKETTWLRPGGGAFVDASGNDNAFVPDGSAMMVTRYTPDTTRPVLLSFTVTQTKRLTLVFNEPMSIESDNIDATKVVLLDNLPQDADPLTFSLIDAVYASSTTDRTQISFALGGESSDFARIQQNSENSIFVFQQRTYLRINEGMMKDTSGNSVKGINAEDSLALGPSISDFDLNMDTGIIMLYFSEEVNSTFSLKNLIIQPLLSDNSSCSTRAYANVPCVVLTSTRNADRYGGSTSTFTMTLSSDDLNSLKFAGLGTSTETTFLAAYFGLTASTSETTIIPRLATTEVRQSQALQVRDLVLDVSPPEVFDFGLDLDTAQLFIFFDEAVRVSMLDHEGVTLLASSIGEAVSLSGYEQVTLVNKTVVVVDLVEADLNDIKRAHYISGLNLDNLLIDANAIQDYQGNYYVGNDEQDPRLVRFLNPDTIAPTVVEAEVDMGNDVFKITFSETVDMGTIQKGKIFTSTQADATLGNVTLNNVVITEIAANVITVDLGLYRTDAVAVKSTIFGTALNDTFITLLGVSDLFGNVKESTTFKATSILQDTGNPELLSFDIDVSTATAAVTVRFSKPMDTTAFDCADFVFVSNRASVPDETVALTSGQCTVTSVGYPYDIEYTFATSLLSTNFLGSSENRFITVVTGSSSTARNGNSVVSLPASSAFRVGPRVSAFTLDMDNGTSTIIFTQPVAVPLKLAPGTIGFAAGVNSMFLGNATIRTIDAESKIALVYFSPEDHLLVKALDVTPTTVVIQTGGDDITSLTDASNTLSETIVSDGIIASRFKKDSTRPVLEFFDLDMTLNELTLIFDEPVRAPVLDQVKNIVLQSVADTSGGAVSTSYRLTSMQSVGVSENVRLKITLSLADSFAMKLDEGLVVSQATTFITIPFNTLEDMAGNFLSPIPQSAGRQVQTFTEDTQNPVLESFAVNMNDGTVTMNFDEPVKGIGFFQLDQVIIQSLFRAKIFSRSDGTEQDIYYPLTGGSVVTGNDDTQVVQLTPTDIHNIKLIPELARTIALTWIQLSENATTDMNNNKVVAIIDGSARLAGSFSADITRPTVQSIKFDANLAILSVTYSELMQDTLTDATRATFHVSAEEGADTYTLTESSVGITNADYPFSETVHVQISDHDMNNIKYLHPLGNSLSSTFVSLSASFARDTFTNQMKAVSVSSPLQASEYVDDITQPQFITYTLDMNTNTIALVFDETLDPSSLDFSQISLQSTTVARFGFKRDLSGSSAVFGTREFSTDVTITIGTAAVADMKRNGIGTLPENSLLSWTNTFISDYAGNYAPPQWDSGIEGFVPLIPSVFTPDASEPTLQSWFMDRESRQFYITFDEPVQLVDGDLFEVFASATAAKLSAGDGTTLANATAVPLEGTNTIVMTVPEICVTASSDGKCQGDTQLEALISVNLPLWLAIAENAVQDISTSFSPNIAVDAATPKSEGAPDCSPCPEGFYTIKLCTSNADKVCQACTDCGAGQYESVACSAYQDTRCAICNACPYGTYMSTPCAGENDVECSPCTRCKNDEFENVACNGITDTVCESCNKCTLPSEQATLKCSAGQYLYYYNANCCIDPFSGETVSCTQQSYSQVKAAATRGRHHWVFPDTSPPIEGYPFGTEIAT